MTDSRHGRTRFGHLRVISWRWVTVPAFFTRLVGFLGKEVAQVSAIYVFLPACLPVRRKTLYERSGFLCKTRNNKTTNVRLNLILQTYCNDY